MQVIQTDFPERYKALGVPKQKFCVEIAGLCDVTPGAVHRWLAGLDTPNQENADKLCDYFKVDNSEMFWIPARKDRQLNKK